jgi:hypothetical protein
VYVDCKNDPCHVIACVICVDWGDGRLSLPISAFEPLYSSSPTSSLITSTLTPSRRSSSSTTNKSTSPIVTIPIASPSSDHRLVRSLQFSDNKDNNVLPTIMESPYRTQAASLSSSSLLSTIHDGDMDKTSQSSTNNIGNMSTSDNTCSSSNTSDNIACQSPLTRKSQSSSLSSSNPPSISSPRSITVRRKAVLGVDKIWVIKKVMSPCQYDFFSFLCVVYSSVWCYQTTASWSRCSIVDG